MKIKIKVTKQDIKKGIKECPETCAVALACMRQFKPQLIEVGSSGSYIEMSGCKYEGEYPFTKKLTDFLIKFDNGTKVEPAEFTLTKEKNESVS